MYLVSCCVRKSPLQEMEGAGLAPHTLQLSLRLEPSTRDSRPELEVTSSLTGASTNSSWSEACRGRTRSVLEASQVTTLSARSRVTTGSRTRLTVRPGELGETGVGGLIRLSQGVKYSYIAVWQNIYLYFCLLFTEINEEHKIFINVAISNLLDVIIT